MRVLLIGTVHAENGRASIAELQAILERSQPDVIFAEIPPADIDHYKDGSRGTLESTAVARYLASHHVDLVPVDMAKPGQKFFDDVEEMFAAIERTSPDYRRMIDRFSVDTRAGGFSYLNSDQCGQLWTNIYREALATIEWVGDSRLRRTYDIWNQTNELRDREMIMNITTYCARNAFARGVFLVGAAHRKSIIDKGFSGNGADLSRIEWVLGSFLDDAG